MWVKLADKLTGDVRISITDQVPGSEVSSFRWGWTQHVAERTQAGGAGAQPGRGLCRRRHRLFLVDTPEQRRIGISDSLELAWRDWLGSAGFDRPEGHWPRQWARAYVEFAAGEKRKYLHDLGLRIIPTVGGERGPAADAHARQARRPVRSRAAARLEQQRDQPELGVEGQPRLGLVAEYVYGTDRWEGFRVHPLPASVAAACTATTRWRARSSEAASSRG